jgi:hypothetical protein
MDHSTLTSGNWTFTILTPRKISARGRFLAWVHITYTAHSWSLSVPSRIPVPCHSASGHSESIRLDQSAMMWTSYRAALPPSLYAKRRQMIWDRTVRALQSRLCLGLCQFWHRPWTKSSHNMMHINMCWSYLMPEHWGHSDQQLEMPIAHYRVTPRLSRLTILAC